MQTPLSSELLFNGLLPGPIPKVPLKSQPPQKQQQAKRRAQKLGFYMAQSHGQPAYRLCISYYQSAKMLSCGQ